ncbi:hypothetical protein ABZU45_19255 [Streptomyces avermitilis]|uniref:hypothetical protein n=1 Tax=Streptomyces avermitilis TaxID=33903 RepID=UPI0033B8F536
MVGRGTGGTAALHAVTPLTHLASQAFCPAAELVAVLRQQLWGIDLRTGRELSGRTTLCGSSRNSSNNSA